MSTSVKFNPVRGTDASIKQQPYHDGYVYFATDTKSIYLDSGGQNKIPMGSASGSTSAGSGIILGSKTLTVDETTQESITFALTDLNIEYAPDVDAIILNTPDGCFYRVTSITDSTHYVALRLSVAGGGGGGGTSTATLTLTVDGIYAGKTFVYGQAANITLLGSVNNEDTKVVYSMQITNVYAGTTTQKTYGPFIADVDSNYNFDLGSKLQLGTNEIIITMTSDNANTTKTYKVSQIGCVEMYLQKSDDFNPLGYYNGAFTFRCIPVGENLTKTCNIYIDGVLEPTLTKTNITAKNDQLDFTIPAQSHGSHSLEVVMTCEESAAEVSLSYNICCIEDGETAPIIWYNSNTPTSIVNHDVLTIEYMVYNPTSTQSQEVRYYINSAEIATSPLYVDYSRTAWLKWRVNGYIVGDNVFTLKSGNTTVQIPVSVAIDTERNLDIVQSGLHVNLTAVGRSNNENSQSRQTWTCTSLYDNSSTSVEFNNFNWYNNGWITDDDGETCLRISNGASINIPIDGVLNTKALSDSLAFEFVFKVRNVGHYGTLINTEVNDTDSDTATVTKTVSSTEGVWGSYYKNSIGFCLGTQEAFFKTKNALVSGRFKEDELVHLTFVIEAAGANSNANKLIYIYINGINSGITKYNTNNDNLKADCAGFKINSTYCDVDLYKFRVYKTNLTAQYVIQNYLADYNDANLYDMNENIVSYSNGVPSIDYLKMLEYNTNHPDAPLMPYMLVETVETDDILPYYKDEQSATSPWRVNATFVNPLLDYEYENNLWDSEVLSVYGYDNVDTMYALSSPSFEAKNAELNVQGTSSQGYPIRNYKIKYKNCDSWTYTKLVDADDKVLKVNKGGTTKAGVSIGKKYHMMNSSIGENKATLKADYMDSSSVHNSGFANLVGKMYDAHPLADYNIEDCDPTKLRTSVCGFPFLMFQKLHTGSGNAQYKFLGWYNYNLDKGCDDTYGFCDWGDDSYVNVTSKVTADNFNANKLYILVDDEYTLVAETVDEGATAVYDSAATYYRLDEGGDSNALNEDYDATDPYSRQYLPWSRAAECWEFSNNQGGRCSFKKANFSELNSEGDISVLDDFEYRYHADADSIDNALNRDHLKEDGDDFTGATSAQVNAYMLKKMSRWERLVSWVVSTNKAGATGADLDTPYVVSETESYTQDTAAYRIAKFKKEFASHFNKEYCMVYYIMTELLLCYDSRGKNLMMATWGPQVRGGNDIWYPIFYDIDTQLGVNNSGVPYWDYYEEASDNGTFSTADSVLWNNLWECFSSDIMTKFNILTGNKLTVDNINGAYGFDPDINLQKCMGGSRPIILKNVDEYQKYITPSISGYYDTTHATVTSDAFYYCLQGTRELQRQMFLRNRFNYISSKWRGGNYSVAKAKQGVQMRFDANDYPNTSDKYLNSTNDVYYYSKPEKVASAGKTQITSQATYDTVKNKKTNIYLLQEDGSFLEDTSGVYDGSKASDYYVHNDYEYGAYPQPLDFVWDFDVTPYLKQYISNIWDDTQLETHYASDGETITIPIPDAKFDDVMNTANYPQQLVYFGGAEYLSSLGDLSKKYIDQLWISGAYRLKDLLIGSDVEGYWNNMMNTDSFHPDDTATITVDGVTKTNPNAKTLLEKVVLTNLTGLTNTIDFSGSEKLKELRALGTKVSSFILADGVQIAKLYLPETITNLVLKEPTSLTGILTSSNPVSQSVETYNSTTVTEDEYNPSLYYINTLDGYKRCDDSSYFTSAEIKADYPDFISEPEDNQVVGLLYNGTRSYYTKIVTTENVYPDGLFIKGLTDLTTVADDSVTCLDTIDIVGGNMGYDSYKLLEKTVQVKEKMHAQEELEDKYDKHLAINLEDVDWTPYRQVATGETALDDSTYYLENDHGELKLYTQVSGEYPNWALNVANGSVYEYDATLYTAHQNDITSLSTLDIFINDYKTAKDVYDSLVNKNKFDSESYNFYQSTDSYAQGPTLAALTGSIFINNSADNPIDEAKIKNYYHDTYYPKLNIFAANIAKCNVSRFVEVTNDETGEIKVWDTLKYSTTDRTYPVISSVVASKLDYDFRGWSVTKYTQAQLDAMTEEEIAAIVHTAGEEMSDMLYTDADDQVWTFYAVYTEHKYTITFKVDDDTPFTTMQVTAKRKIPVPTIVPYKTEAEGDFTDIESAWVFKGYATTKTITSDNQLLATTTEGDVDYFVKTATGDLTIYLLFKEGSVYDTVLDEKYFVWKKLPVTLINEAGGYEDPVTGWVMLWNSNYELSGKITLPVTHTEDGVEGPVIALGSVDGQYGCLDDVRSCSKNITHVFFDRNKTCNILAIQNYFFGEDSSTARLKYVKIPDSVKMLGYGCFYACTALLTDSRLTNAQISGFLNKVEYIENYAFYNNMLKKIYIPGSVYKIGNRAFHNVNSVVEEVYLGSDENPISLIESNIGTDIINRQGQTYALYGWASSDTVKEVLQNCAYTKFNCTGSTSIEIA